MNIAICLYLRNGSWFGVLHRGMLHRGMQGGTEPLGIQTTSGPGQAGLGNQKEDRENLRNLLQLMPG